MALTIDIDRGAGTLEVTSEDRVYIRDGSLSVRVNGLLDSDRQLSPWIQIFSCDRLMAEAALVLDEDAGQDGKIGGECILSTDTVPFVRSFAGCRNETCRSFGVRVFSGDAENPKPIALGTVEVWNFPSVGGEPAMLPTAHEIVKKLDEKVDEHVADKSNPHRVTVEQIGAIPASKESEFAKAAAVTRLEQDIAANRQSAEQAIEVVSVVVSGHIQNTDNPHGVTKEKLGLGNVDNTRDAEKPVSHPQGVAIESAKADVMNSVAQALLNYYNKSDSPIYTKAEVDQLVSAIPKFKVEVVSALPESGHDTTTVYLVKTGDEGMNLYTEYIRADNKWEQLGTQKLDLRNYATKIDLAQEKITLRRLIDLKQGKLVAGTNITIDPVTNTISATGVGGEGGGDHITPESIGALPIGGGTLSGDLSVGTRFGGARTLVVGSENGANAITLVGGNSDLGSAMTIGGSSTRGGRLVVEDGGTGGASILKGDKEVATEEQVGVVSDMAKYPVVMKSGSVVMLDDRKVNVYSGTLSSDVTLVLPAANEDGRVRDLEFRANVSGLRLVSVRRTDASGTAITLVSMSPESTSAEEGVNAWYFTETGGEVRVELALLKPAGYQVKMDFTCGNTSGHGNDVDFLDSAGETIKSIKFEKQTLSEIVSGVSSLRIDMSHFGHVVVNGTTYDWVIDENPRTIVLAGDSVITSSWADDCLAPDTPILTPSGPVALKDVHVGDTVLGVDRRGGLRPVKVTRCDTRLEKWADACDRWTFARENGDKFVLTTVKRHRLYNVERAAMVYMDEWDVGEHGRDSDGCELELVSHEHVDGPARHMTLFTETQTYFVHGLLSGNRHTPHIDWEDR